MGVFKPAIGRPEVIEAMIERHASDGDLSSPISVKSDRPTCPTSWVWRKMTSCSWL